MSEFTQNTIHAMARVNVNAPASLVGRGFRGAPAVNGQITTLTLQDPIDASESICLVTPETSAAPLSLSPQYSRPNDSTIEVTTQDGGSPAPADFAIVVLRIPGTFR